MYAAYYYLYSNSQLDTSLLNHLNMKKTYRGVLCPSQLIFWSLHGIYCIHKIIMFIQYTFHLVCSVIITAIIILVLIIVAFILNKFRLLATLSSSYLFEISTLRVHMKIGQLTGGIIRPPSVSYTSGIAQVHEWNSSCSSFCIALEPKKNNVNFSRIYCP